jgi:anti-sigma B factor antagonist
MSLELKSHHVGDVLVLQPSGRLTLGEASNSLHDTVRSLVQRGERKILLDLADVSYIDSSGLGELVSAYTSLRREGGDLKLACLSTRTHDLMRITRLSTVFEVFDNDTPAILSFTS